VVRSNSCKGPVYSGKRPKKSQRAKRKFLGQEVSFGANLTTLQYSILIGFLQLSMKERWSKSCKKNLPPANFTRQTNKKITKFGGKIAHLAPLIQWHVVVTCIWCVLFATPQFAVIVMFQTNVLAKFVDIMHIFLLYIHSPYFMRHCTKYKLSALQARL